MGIKIGKAFKKVAKLGARVSTAIVTGGLSEAFPKNATARAIGSIIKTVQFPSSIKEVATTAAIGAPLVGAAVGGVGGAVGANIVTGAITGAALQPQVTQPGGIEMGFTDRLLGGLSGALGAASGFGGQFGTVANVGSQFLSGFLPAQGPVRSTVGTFPSTLEVIAGLVPQLTIGDMSLPLISITRS